MLSSLIIAGTFGVSVVAQASCDMVEVNHVMGSTGNEHFVQAIAWDYFQEFGRHHAQAWVAVDDWQRTQTGVRLVTASGVTLDVRCKYFKETWTRHDPEIADRDKFPIKFRRPVW